MSIVSKLFNNHLFIFVFQADLQNDIFFWITGFTMSYFLLKRLHEDKGFWTTHPARVFFERYLRIVPLYLFMIFFMWKFVNTLGGNGPRFYQFEESHSCSETWLHHLLMVNNMIPW